MDIPLNPENVCSNPSRNRYIKKRTYNVRFSKNVHSMSVFQNVHPMSCFISNPQMSVSGQIMYVKKTYDPGAGMVAFCKIVQQKSTLCEEIFDSTVESTKT